MEAAMPAFQVSLAPTQLAQTINPWTWAFSGGQFGLINIDLGQSGDASMERRMLDKVGSYGRQLGRLGDAMKVVLAHLDRGALTREEANALAVLEAQLIEVDRVKRSTG
jgi:hypothetical protein